MKYIFNKEKLKQVLLDFYKSTGIAIALYDASAKAVAGSPYYTSFCSYVRSEEYCCKNCDLSNLTHMKEVSERRKIIRYTCHAGLMESIFPIIYEDVLIAYLQIGQIRDSEEIYSTSEWVRGASEKYGFDAEKLLNLYSDVPVISEEKLHSIYNIMKILITSFWTDGLISRNRSMLSVKIEQYIEEHMAEDIYTEELSDNFFLSKNGLYQLFRDEFNTTVNEFITSKRLGKAQELLLGGADMSIAQISSLCGFGDYNYFIRTFKKHFGITPLQYKKHGGKEKTVIK